MNGLLLLVILAFVGNFGLLSVALARSERRSRLLSDLMVSKLNWKDGIEPLEFERRCSEFLKMCGWRSRTTKASGDQGADIVATKDGITVVCQCKRYSKSVGNKAVQEVFAAKTFYNAQRGAVITNSGYTKSAIELAGKTGIELFHFSDLLKFNSRMVPGSTDVSIDALSVGKIEPEEYFKKKQSLIWFLYAVDCIVVFALFSIFINSLS
jgi:HJR/Mrr/RecB family endonuclease